MRDFRDAKAMAHTLRAALAAKGHKVINSESLELIAQAFGVADWNTLSAAIRGEAAGSRNNAHSPQFPATATMRALAYARQRKHQYATLEHLLLALIDDLDASAVMKACKVDLGALREKLTNYIDNRPVNTGNRRRRRTQAYRWLSARASARGALCRRAGSS